jgi:hypothetical protein
MEKENIAVGLDIGTTKIVAMIGKKNEYGKLEILGVGKSKSLGVARGVVNKRCCGGNCGATHPQYSTYRLHQQTQSRRSYWRE